MIPSVLATGTGTGAADATSLSDAIHHVGTIRRARVEMLRNSIRKSLRRSVKRKLPLRRGGGRRWCNATGRR